MLTKFLCWMGLKAREEEKSSHIPVILHRSQHQISRQNISKNALKVLYRLHDAGFEAYLVGGGVRDVLLGQHPKDFDVVTNAHPEEISNLFRNSRMIGRRFRLVHVHFGGHIVEVATFRAAHSGELNSDPSLSRAGEEGMLLRDNIYGTLEEDVWRRDFTINAIYYNIADFSLIDYVKGIEDLNHRIIRMIGDPAARYREDPVRMLRAIRFAAKLNFQIEEKTAKPIMELAPLLANVPGARLFDEYIKLFLSGHALLSFKLLREFRLFSILFPRTDEFLNNEIYQSKMELFLRNAFDNTDKRVAEERPVAPFYLLAALWWIPVKMMSQRLIQEQDLTEFQALMEAFEIVLHEQRSNFSIPRRMTQAVREVWVFQIRLQKRSGNRAKELFSHTRFRAAYDFLLLRMHSGETEVETLADWWTTYIEANEKTREMMAFELQKKQKKRKRRKRTGVKSAGFVAQELNKTIE